MPKRPCHEEREQRITDEIFVDTFSPEEQAMGWYYYLEDNLEFLFEARCIAERAISPLRFGDLVEVIEMAAEEECEHEMFVLTHWGRRTLAVIAAVLVLRETFVLNLDIHLRGAHYPGCRFFKD